MQKRFLYAIIGLCALCLILAGALIYREIDARVPPAILQENAPPTIIAVEPTPIVTTIPPTSIPQTTDASATLSALPQATLTATSGQPAITTTTKPTAIPSVTTSLPKPISGFGNIVIKDNTFEVKKGVDEATLKNNIGWMETSALPGADGVCILMGHRNTQFRILKDVKKGDPISITGADGITYFYTIQSAKVVLENEKLSFPAQDGKVLTLMTCYPFYFQGHAPHKYIVVAKIMQ